MKRFHQLLYLAAAFVVGAAAALTFNQHRAAGRMDPGETVAYVVMDSTGLAWADSVRRVTGGTYLRLAPGMYVQSSAAAKDAEGLFHGR